jgi:hypothetical protein
VPETADALTACAHSAQHLAATVAAFSSRRRTTGKKLNMAIEVKVCSRARFGIPMRGLYGPIQITVGCWHVTVLQHELYKAAKYPGPKKKHQRLGSSWAQSRFGPFICHILRKAVRRLAGQHQTCDLWFPPRRALSRKLSSQAAIYVPSPTHPLLAFSSRARNR